MSKTKRAMKGMNIKYFSSLTPKQKDKCLSFVIGSKFNDLSLKLTGVYKQIFNPIPHKWKVFYLKDHNVWIPLNIGEIIK